MPEYAFPFAGRNLAAKELSYDMCYNKIPVEDREKIIEHAWQKGVNAANNIFKKFNGEFNFFKIAKESKLKCIQLDKDYIVGNQRYFSDYVSGKHKITLYIKSIELWAKENALDIKTAQNVILSHEYFHFLEWTELGLTSREYQVPMIILGKLKIGKTGISALSEIGAHAFSRTYYDLLTEEENKNAK